MAIKVIKHGEKPKFKKTCPNCGCVFEYEVEDLQIEPNWSLNSWNYPAHKKRVVICPDCGEKIYHDTIVDEIYPTYPNVIYCNDNLSLDCDKCPNKPDPLHPVFGDSPCTWCSKMQPYCTGTTTLEGKNLNTDVKIDTSLYAGTSVDYSNVLANTDFGDVKTNYTTNLDNK